MGALTPAVHDDAKFFTADAVSKADAIIKDIKERHGKDLLIETFSTAPAGREEEAKDADAAAKNRFFNEWAVQRARAEHVNGIYVLICKDPPFVKPVVGNQTLAIFNTDDRDHLGQILVDRFKKKQYDDGLLEAVRYVQSTLNQNDSAKAAGGQTTEKQGPDVWSPYGGRRPAAGMGGLSMGLGGCLCVGLVVVGVLALGAMAVSALFRSFGHGPGGYGPGGYGPGPGGYGYGPGGYGGQGGGFLSSILGGLFGGAAGSWAYDRFFGGHSSPNQGSWQAPNAAPPHPASAPEDTSYSAGGGGDFGGGDSGGGDAGGGGDFGGGDAGGGGDFGGGGGGGGNDSGGGF